MGSLYEFSCPGCGYRVEVCGGLGYGMLDVDHTVSCPTCRRLSDLELPCKVWEVMDDLDRPILPGGPRPAWLPERIRCALDRRHKATLWGASGTLSEMRRNPGQGRENRALGLGQGAGLQAVFVGVLAPAPVDDGRLGQRRTHGPVDQARILVVDEPLS